jgi:hypothetical protein
MVENLLKLDNSFAALVSSEVAFFPHIDGVQGRPIVGAIYCA